MTCTFEEKRKRRAVFTASDVGADALRGIVAAADSKCYYCGEQVQCFIKKSAPVGFDHKTPLCRGGQHSAENLCVCCQGCNVRKGIRTEQEYWDFQHGAAA